MLVHGRHFRFDWSSAEEVGRKAIAQNGADIEAMGARCTGFLVALGCPRDTPLSVTDGLNEGMWLEAVRAGAGIVGGDMVASDQVVISITALGDLEGRAPVLRSGARAGDVVALRGRLGWSAAGLAVLLDHDGEPSHFPLEHIAVVEAHRVPQPPYGSGAEAAIAGASSLIDVSDGLLADLGHIALASSVDIDIDPDALVVADEVASAAASLGTDPLDWALRGGEDHALVGTFAHRSHVPAGWTVIGTASTPREHGEVRVVGRAVTGIRGWSSFGPG